MADHLDAPGLTSPGNDARLDITDVYAFQKPGDPDKSILMLNVNPLAPTLANAFRHDAVYRLNIDTDGDVKPERAFNITFSEVEDGKQEAEVHLAVLAEGDEGQEIIDDAPVSFGASPIVTENGPFKFFAGIRSDPFFFDLAGFLRGDFSFDGTDFFANLNVFGIALEVPNSALGDNPNIGIWGRTLVRQHGHKKGEKGLIRVDRMGRPAINTVFNKGDDKNVFNEIDPDRDRELFLAKFIKFLEQFHNPTDASNIAQILLPDLLTYNSGSAEGFLNGRNLTDDVIDIALGLVTNGAITSDGVDAHTDLLDDFPYMGHPH